MFCSRRPIPRTTPLARPTAATPLITAIERLADDGGVIPSTGTLLANASEMAERHAISVYDAAYAAAATDGGHRLVSCDERDLVSKHLAVLPTDARAFPPETIVEVDRRAREQVLAAVFRPRPASLSRPRFSFAGLVLDRLSPDKLRTRLKLLDGLSRWSTGMSFEMSFHDRWRVSSAVGTSLMEGSSSKTGYVGAAVALATVLVS